MSDDWTLKQIDAKSSFDQLTNFLAGPVWHDIKSEIEIWEQLAINGLTETGSIDEIWRLQGRLQMCRAFLELPEALRDFLDVNETINKRK